MLGCHERAGDHYGQALQIAQATGDRSGELTALTGLGTAVSLTEAGLPELAPHR